MRPAHIKSYTPAFELDKPITSLTIARVLKSTSDEFKEGETVIGTLPIAQYSVKTLDQNKYWPLIYRLRHLKNTYDLKDLRVFTGALGMPGLTAYSSFYEIGAPKRGETIFISSAAGAVGQLVGQLAKHEGLTVIGSVGSDQKLDFITKELGFDSGFNYKSESPEDALKRLAPNGIDIYYENVGGAHLEAAINAMNDFGRIICCGMIGEYNKPMPEKYPIRNLFYVVSKRLTMRGFIVSDKEFSDKYYEEHLDKVGKWLSEGTFKVRIDTMGTIEQGDKALVGMFEGKNLGKAVLDCQTGGKANM